MDLASSIASRMLGDDGSLNVHEGEIILSPRQQEFIDAVEREQCYGGAKRGGKTVAGSVKSALLSYYFPGNRGLMARQNWPDLRDSTLTTFKKYCGGFIQDERVTDKILIIHSQDAMYPSIIMYRGLGDEKDSEKVKGMDLGWFWIDEPSEVKLAIYMMLRAQLNWICAHGMRPPYMAFLTTNPEPGWVKRRYKDDEFKMVANKIARFIQALPRDNPFLPEGWEAELRRDFDPEWVQKYLDGDWSVGERNVFTLSDEVHNLDNYVSDHDWYSWCLSLKLYAGQDHASTGISANVLCGQDSSDFKYGLEEYYVSDKTIDVHARAILGMYSSYGMMPEYTIIDPSTEGKTLQGKNVSTGVYEMYSVQDEYRRHGLHTISAQRQHIGVGLDVMKQQLFNNVLRRHPIRKDKMGAPMLMISKKRCPNLWREMEDLRKKFLADGSVVYVGQDHALDCLRYWVMSRPLVPAVVDTMKALPPQAQFVVNAHTDWAKKFDREINGGTGQWF